MFRPMNARLYAAFAAVYVVWGSTYLAIRFAVETLPPFLMAGARFVLAGGILLVWARATNRGRRAPTKTDWKTGLVSGALLLLCGNGGVVWAEQRVPSGIAALLVAVVPFWMVLLDWMRPGGRRPPMLVFVGLALGLAGLGLLVGRDALDSAEVSLSGAIVLILASLAWAAGSLYTKHAPKASSSLHGSGTQMIAGGLCLTVAAVVAGEPWSMDLANASSRSILGFLYLVTFGSLIGFTAYFYLLEHTTAAKAATYAYVNPVVAVLLGWAFADEPITARTLGAAAIILGGVAIITTARERAPETVKGERAAA